MTPVSPLKFTKKRCLCRKRSRMTNCQPPAKQASIDWAVRYLTAIRLGWVRGDGARDRVAALYGVTLRQVERWLAAAGLPHQREVQLREWAESVGLRPFSEAEAGKECVD